MEFHFDKPDSRSIKGEIQCRRILRYLLFDLIIVPSNVALPLYGPVGQDPPLGCPAEPNFGSFPLRSLIT